MKSGNLPYIVTMMFGQTGVPAGQAIIMDLGELVQLVMLIQDLRERPATHLREAIVYVQMDVPSGVWGLLRMD